MKISISILVIALYGLSRLYSQITQKNPESKLEAAQLKEAFSRNSGVWWFMYPITSLLFIIYDSILRILWFVGEIFNFILVVLKWIYNEIILAGLIFILELCWHYLILCPWRIFRSAFLLIPVASKWRSFKMGILGIFFSLIIILLSRFITTFIIQENETAKLVLQHIFQLVSLIPLGIAAVCIANQKSNDSGSWKANSRKFIRLSLFLLLPILLVLGLEYIIIYLGSCTSAQFTLSSILMGGSLLSSFILLINSCLIIFLVSALPAFSVQFNGNFRTFYSEFSKHIFNGWAAYLIGIPSIILPTILLSIIPFFATQGITFLSQITTNYVYEKRISDMEDDLSKSQFSYHNWCDIEAISDDSIQKLIELDFDYLDLKISSNALNRGRNYLDQAYANYSNLYGAAPIGVMYYLYDKYSAFQNQQVHTAEVSKSDDITGEYARAKNEISSDSISKSKDINDAVKYISAQEKELALVCIEPLEEDRAETVSGQVETGKVEASTPEEKDRCDIIRDRISNEIAKAREFVARESKNQARKGQIIQHINEISAEIKSANDWDKFSRAGAFLFSGIWMCLLAAITYGYGLSILSHLNSKIFRDTDSSDWHIIERIKDANEKNVNQPLLGTGVVLGILTLFIIGYTEFGSHLKENFNLPKLEFLSNFMGQENANLEFDLRVSPTLETDTGLEDSDGFDGVERPVSGNTIDSSLEHSVDLDETNFEQLQETEKASNEQKLKITRQCVHCQKMFDPRKGFAFNEEGEVISYQPGYTVKYCSLDCAQKD